MKIPEGAVISQRQKTSDPNHHLWKNHGIWWFHATVHLPDYTSRRVRFSLRTRKLGEAQRRRDEILERHSGRPDRSTSANKRLIFLFGEVREAGSPEAFAQNVFNHLERVADRNEDGSLDLTNIGRHLPLGNS